MNKYKPNPNANQPTPASLPLRLAPRRILAVAVASAVGVIVLAPLGCGGGGGGTGGSTGGNAQQDIADGVAILNNIIRNTVSADTANLTAASNDFSAAITLSPNNPQANTGFAIAQSALSVEEGFGLLGLTTPALKQAKSTAPSPADSGLAAIAGLAQIWNARTTLHGPNPGSFAPPFLIGSIYNVAAPSRSFPESPTYAQTRTLLLQIEPQLQAAITALGSHPTTDQNYLTVADPNNTANLSATVNLGGVEASSLKSGLEALLAAVEILLSYDLDPTDTQWNTALSTVFATQFQSSSPITANMYLPAAPVGQLYSDGASRMRQAGSILKSCAADALAGLNALSSRTAAGFLVTGTTFGNVAQATQDATFAQACFAGSKSLTYQYTQDGVNYQNGTTTLNLPQWFNSPPSDLRTVLPTMVPSTITGIAVEWPDLTFGGLFSPALPNQSSNSLAQGLTVGQFYGSLLSSIGNANGNGLLEVGFPWPQP